MVRKKTSKKSDPKPDHPQSGGNDEQTPAPGPEPAVGSRFARFTVPRNLDDDHKREQWQLPPRDSDQPGQYIIELNVQHRDGLMGAEQEFLALVDQVLPPPAKGKGKGSKRSRTPPRPRPLRIAKTYYRCELTDREWRRLIALDEQRPPRERAVYRLWPDFPVQAQTMRSAVTIKADAALRSFDAGGEGIVWAVIDSGVDGNHPHFTLEDEDLLRDEAVVGLHRCFADIYEDREGVFVKMAPLDSPDWDPTLDRDKRKALIEQHRQQALQDDYGHGTHVAGIIAGRAPEPGRDDAPPARLFLHEHKVDQDGNKVTETYASQPMSSREQRHRPPRGMAPRCKLVSLKVLDHQGRGRASQIIQALEYIREVVNDNPKMMRIHGVNLSVGYEFDAEMFACGQSPLCTAVDRLVQEGVVVVAAAGNTGYGVVAASVGSTQVGLSNTINDPGNANQAITVGSTHRDSPHTFGISYFSSKGPTGDGRLKPDLVAPGERIISCAAGSKLNQARQATSLEEDTSPACYIDDSGTSMAAPHVSGAVAAFLSIRREFIGRPQEVKRIFLASATPLGRERYFEGHGLLDLMRAVQAV